MPEVLRPPAGTLRHQLTLTGPKVVVADGAGGYTESHAIIATVWGDLEPVTSMNLERVFGGKLQGEATLVATIRYRSDVTLSGRIIFGARTFEIVGLQNPGERNVTLLLACTEMH